MNLRATFAGFALVCAAATGASSVWAQASATPSAEDRKAASAAFKEGDRAFKSGDFRRAAEAYETAYQHAPHYAPIWNAARAWESAGEPARAANLYAKFLREAPPAAPDRSRATAALNKLAAKLGRIDVHVAEGLSDPTIDGDPIGAGDRKYVSPGQHVVAARAGDRVVREETSVAAGEATSVALSPPAPEPVKEQPPAPVANVAPPPPHGWSPVVVAFGGAVTGIVAGLAIWSGLDTLHQKDTFDTTPTQDNLDQGRSKQQRTNLLIGAAAGVGALTAACALFLVDWHAHDQEKGPEPTGAASLRLRVGPGSIGVGGAF